MHTSPAAKSLAAFSVFDDAVTSVDLLLADGWTVSAIRAQLAARRWQRVGRAIVRHNGLTLARDLRTAALITLGPRALLTSFTALEEAGLVGWEREPVHVLIPRGARVRRPDGLSLRIHYTNSWPTPVAGGRRGRVAHAAVLAASSFATTRPGCGLLAATVQQRLARPADLVEAATEASRTRHRRPLLAATQDIAQGAQALSEIDFVQLCRRHNLPEPVRQAVRIGPSGQRRYVDAEWRSRRGKRIVAEVDGALHLIVGRWWDDQLRQNELVITGDVVLRFPSVVVRHEQDVVADQLRRAFEL